VSQGQYQYEYLDIEGELILSTKNVVHAVDLCTRLASRARFWATIHAGRRESKQEVPEIHCVPDDNKTQHHPRHAGGTYGEAQGTF
jgi:hypothetical protein